jgi:putative molybdopterin biosynthesis protein
MQESAGKPPRISTLTELASRYLTTRELADLLRIKERKVYELAASGEVPCSRATGKLLFPRDKVDAWLEDHSSGPATSTSTAAPAVMLGSHDPLLEWAMRESRCGLAAYFDSSIDGLERFANHEGVAAGLHIRDEAGIDWNIGPVKQKLSNRAVVVVEWARRQRGLILPPDNPAAIKTLGDTAQLRLAARQPEAGSQILLTRLLEDAGNDTNLLDWTKPARSEADAALMVQDGNADMAFGLASVATQLRLEFVPVVEERYDLVVDRRAWFEAPMQKLVTFCRSPALAEKAAALTGYDVSAQFQVHFNSD